MKDRSKIEEDKAVRAKLLARGAQGLSDAELVSVVLSEGSGEDSALELAEKLLARVNGSLRQLNEMDFGKLRMTENLGVKRAAVLSSALELGLRFQMEKTEVPGVIESNQDVIRMFQPKISSLKHEEFWVLYLNSANRLLDHIRVSQGGVSGMVVDHKLVVKRAVELLASSIILVHNHPSGVARPSDEDRELTDRLVIATSLFDITVLDHLIVTTGDCFSFRREGMIVQA